MDGHRIYKYSTIMDMIYKAVFCEKAKDCFADCNKQISITLTANIFLKNGYMYLLKNFMEEMEAIGYHVAAGHIDRDLLTEVMR